MEQQQFFVCEQDNNFENTKWFLEGLCNQYKAAFDSLKQVLPFCQCRLSGQQMEQFQFELDCVERNLSQLEAHYKSLESAYFESLNGITNALPPDVPVDNCTSLNAIEATYYQFEPNDNLNYELANCNLDAIGSEKLSFSSMEYLLAIDDADDFFEFIKSPADAELCTQTDNNCHLTGSDQESQSRSCPLTTAQKIEESKPGKRNTKTTQSRTSNKHTKANGAQKKSRPNEARIWYKCGWEGCSFGSYYNGVVKRHSLKRHSGKIKIDKSSNSSMHRFKCDWPGCEVSLVAYHKLVEHKRKHTGEKPFRCKWKSCNYATARLYSMIIHERTHKLDAFAE